MVFFSTVGLPLFLDIDGASDDDHNDEQDGATNHTRQEDYWNKCTYIYYKLYWDINYLITFTVNV